jgi:hypothetical protein
MRGHRAAESAESRKRSDGANDAAQAVRPTGFALTAENAAMQSAMADDSVERVHYCPGQEKLLRYDMSPW